MVHDRFGIELASLPKRTTRAKTQVFDYDTFCPAPSLVTTIRSPSCHCEEHSDSAIQPLMLISSIYTGLPRQPFGFPRKEKSI